MQGPKSEAKPKLSQAACDDLRATVPITISVFSRKTHRFSGRAQKKGSSGESMGPLCKKTSGSYGKQAPQPFLQGWGFESHFVRPQSIAAILCNSFRPGSKFRSLSICKRVKQAAHSSAEPNAIRKKFVPVFPAILCPDPSAMFSKILSDARPS